MANAWNYVPSGRLSGDQTRELEWRMSAYSPRAWSSLSCHRCDEMLAMLRKDGDPGEEIILISNWCQRWLAEDRAALSALEAQRTVGRLAAVSATYSFIAARMSSPRATTQTGVGRAG